MKLQHQAPSITSCGLVNRSELPQLDNVLLLQPALHHPHHPHHPDHNQTNTLWSQVQQDLAQNCWAAAADQNL